MQYEDTTLFSSKSADLKALKEEIKTKKPKKKQKQSKPNWWQCKVCKEELKEIE